MNRSRVIIAIVAVAFVLALFPTAYRWWIWKQWFHIQDQQMATIMELEAHPPDGWSDQAWENEVGMLHNVWGNVTFAPDYSNISNAEMLALRHELDFIAGQADSSNSVDSVDQIYGILAARGQSKEFIGGFRKEFQSQFPKHEFAKP